MGSPQVDPARLQAEQKWVWNDAAPDFSDATAITESAAQVVSDRLIALGHVITISVSVSQARRSAQA